MGPFFNPMERALIKRDYAQMVEGGGTTVDIRYRMYADILSPDLDPIYKNDRRQLHPTEQEKLAVPCILQIVKQRDVQILGFGILEVGDAILYFREKLNLAEPICDKPAAVHTLYFVDPYGGQWSPVLGDVGPLRRFLAMVIHNEAIAEVVPCKLRK